MLYLQKNALFLSGAFVTFLFALTLLNSNEIQTDSKTIIQTTIDTSSEADEMASCNCEYLVYSPNTGTNTIKIKRGGNIVFSATSTGNHIGSFTVNSSSVYKVIWEAPNGGTANVGMECCNVNCKTANVSVPSSGGSTNAFNYATGGCSPFPCGPTCW